MICKNCGTNNIDGTNFCIKCGSSLKTIQPEPIMANSNQSINMAQTAGTNVIGAVAGMPNQGMQPTFEQQPMNNQQPVNNGAAINAEPLNYFKFMVAMFLKPFSSFKKEEEKLTNPSTSLIFSVIIAVIMVLVSIIKTILNVVIVKSYSSKTSLEFERLKYIKWGELIGRNLLIYVGIIVAIALVYYILSLVFKKNSNFIKLLSISASAQIPFIVLSMIVSPLLGYIWNPLSLIAMVLGVFYTIIIMYELINDDLNFEGDMKIYFNMICWGILVVSGYYALLKMYVGASVFSLIG